MGSQEPGGNRGGDRESILARRAVFVASALGGLGLAAPRTADGQEAAPAPSSAPSASSLASPEVCLSLHAPERPRERGLLAGITSDFWLSLDALGDKARRPPNLLGGWIHLGSPVAHAGSVELRLALAGGFFASNRGTLFPTGGQAQVVFATIPGGFAALTLGGGWLLGASTYEGAAGEWRFAGRSIFAEGSMVPFGFRFGRENRGELGLRFGAIYTKVKSDPSERWAVAFVSSGAWLTYLF
jgi:hypothetical protein